MSKTQKIDVHRAVEMYTVQHLTVRQIGAMMGVSGAGVCRALKKAGVGSADGEHVNGKCEVCGGPFTMTRSRWRKYNRHFCSSACYLKSLENPDYNPNRQGQRIARRTAERHIALQPGHVVHHCDSDNENNNLENLAVFRNQAEHMRFERGGDAKPVWSGLAMLTDEIVDGFQLMLDSFWDLFEGTPTAPANPWPNELTD
jgi:hypothetical protein